MKRCFFLARRLRVGIIYAETTQVMQQLWLRSSHCFKTVELIGVARCTAYLQPVEKLKSWLDKYKTRAAVNSFSHTFMVYGMV